MDTEAASNVSAYNRSESSGQKSAARLSVKIQEHIVSLGWPVGELLGSERELIERYGVSRSILREAVRILESRDLVRMRKGPGGGLLVSEPKADIVSNDVALYLQSRGVAPQSVFAARTSLELTCVQLAASDIDEEGIELLRSILSDEQSQGSTEIHTQRFHTAVAELSGNPVLFLLVEVLAQAIRDRVPARFVEGEDVESVRYAHERISEAIIVGDAGLARYRMQRHLEAVATYYTH